MAGCIDAAIPLNLQKTTENKISNKKNMSKPIPIYRSSSADAEACNASSSPEESVHITDTSVSSEAKKAKGKRRTRRSRSKGESTLADEAKQLEETLASEVHIGATADAHDNVKPSNGQGPSKTNADPQQKKPNSPTKQQKQGKTNNNQSRSKNNNQKNKKSPSPTSASPSSSLERPSIYKHSAIRRMSISSPASSEEETIKPIRQPVGPPTLQSIGFSSEYRKSRKSGRSLF